LHPKMISSESKGSWSSFTISFVAVPTPSTH